MPALARGDAERLLRFVGEAESLGGDEPFTGDLLVELGKLVECDWLDYNERDAVGRHLLEVRRPGDYTDWNGECFEDFYAVQLFESPIGRCRLQGQSGALMISDFLTRRELHKTRFYEIALHPFGVEQAIEVDVSSSPSRWRTFYFDNAERAFSERDRLVLDILQPHLVRLWETAKTRRELTAALTGLDQTEASEARGVILLDPRDEVEYVSGAARRLLREFDTTASLVAWLESGNPRPLVQRRGERRLIVERVGDALLLEETFPDLGLTPREREVLDLVGHGKTNIEIASILWLAPSTVSKHLENSYRKLGVTNRTAAAAQLLGTSELRDAHGGP